MNAKLKRPAPAKIDDLIARFAELQGEVIQRRAALNIATSAADYWKDQLVELVEAFGVKHAEKSKRLTGIRNTATTTTGTMVVVEDEAVEKFKAYLDGVEMPRLREQFFSERVTYQLVDGPDEVLKTLDLGKKMRNRMTALVKACFKIRTKAPSLRVDVGVGK